MYERENEVYKQNRIKEQNIYLYSSFRSSTLIGQEAFQEQVQHHLDFSWFLSSRLPIFARLRI